jgi:hypothetical protein
MDQSPRPGCRDTGLPAEIMENAICVPRFDEAALGSGEDQPRLAPARAGGKPLLELSFAVCPQNGHQWVRYGQHRDRCVGLHRVQPQLAVDPMQCLPDRHSARVEIDVAHARPSASPRRSPHLRCAGPRRRYSRFVRHFGAVVCLLRVALTSELRQFVSGSAKFIEDGAKLRHPSAVHLPLCAEPQARTLARMADSHSFKSDERMT